MRDYGVVKVRFWAWAKEKGLSIEAQRMALYCLTSPHSNSLGCFRLPLAYIAEDLGTVVDTVRETVSELVSAGFLKHDSASGWVWIVGYLDHNPIANGNVGKSLVSFINGIPRHLSFYPEVVATLARQRNRFPDGYIEGLANGIGNGFREGMANHDHDQTHEHEHNHNHDRDGAGGAPADDPPQVSNEERAVEIWNEAAERNGWPVKRQALTQQQRRQLSARLKVGGVEQWQEAVQLCEQSDFLSGRKKPTAGHEGWRLRLTFLLSPQKYAAILDGEYANSGDRPPSGAAPPSRVPPELM